MLFTLVKAAKSIGAQGLHDANVNVGIVMLHERGAIKIEEAAQAIEIMIEQLLSQIWRQVGLGIIQKRSNIVLQRAFAAALIVQEKWLVFVQDFAQHDVAGLKIPIEKIIAAGAQQQFRQAAEIAFHRLLVEWDAGQTEKVILEIIQIPRDGLAIEAGARIAHFVVQIAARFDLKARQHGNNFAIGRDRLGSDGRALAVVREKLKKRGAAKVFYEIRTVA